MEEQLRKENESLQASLVDIQNQFQTLEEEKVQIQKCYDQAIQEVADGEAKREAADKELKQAHSQIESMWEELKSLRQRLDMPPAPPTQQAAGDLLPSQKEEGNESLTLTCSLCNNTISLSGRVTSQQPSPISVNSRQNNHHHQQQNQHKQPNHQQDQQNHQQDQQNHRQEQHKLQHRSLADSPKQQQKVKKGSWFNRKQNRVQDLESHSKLCYSASRPLPNSPHKKTTPTSSPKSCRKMASFRGSKSPARARLARNKGEESAEEAEFLVVNVTRSSQSGGTDVAPFKIITKTNLTVFPSTTSEVHRSQGDFQWLHAALQEACPERIVPPLRPPISLDATMSEFQRFLSRVASHKGLSRHHLYISFLTCTAKDLRSIKAKHRPRNHGSKMTYKPVVGRDTSSGPLVDAKDYLTMLEQNLSGLTSHLEQGARRGYGSPMERSAHWFRAISDSEPGHTYLKKASADLARTCESMEGQMRDSDEVLFIQNLHSLTDYVRVAQELLVRVEEAVDEYLYWDEELTIIESVNSSSIIQDDRTSGGAVTGVANHSSTSMVGVVSTCPEIVFDDSGVSDVASNSTNSTGEDMALPDCHMAAKEGSQDSGSDIIACATTERWAKASKRCVESKDHLEFMCADLAEELSLFDLHKERELRQILLDYASSQLEKHETFQGKWFAIKYLLDTPIPMDQRAIQFTNPASATPTKDDIGQSEESL